ncbi:hypothetical protein UY3_01887 [Chelonia mydas]|uniref:Uncharacterized protein n=1 Tax=Chelonia mydas TaxID=8469 RepID=M7BSP1_CHEMY|nr:hypothetical protein UY3_01887 [Chelonia mydas]
MQLRCCKISHAAALCRCLGVEGGGASFNCKERVPQGRLYQFRRPKQSPQNCHRRKSRRGGKSSGAAAELPLRDMGCRPILNAAPSACLESWCLELALMFPNYFKKRGRCSTFELPAYGKLD